MDKSRETIEHQRIYDKIVASNPATNTLDEYLRFMSCGDLEAAMWSVAEICHTSIDAIKGAAPDSYVIVAATKVGPGQIEINSCEFYLEDPKHPPGPPEPPNVPRLVG
jgi:hypothetical protein